MAGRRGRRDGLGDRQRRFALEYLVEPNARRAAERAGYSRRTAEKAGPRLLKHPAVRAFIEEHQRAIEEHLVLTAEKVDQEVARVAFLDPARCFDAEGRLLHPKDMPEDVRRAIASFEEEALFDTVSVPEGEKERKVRVQVGVIRKLKWASKLEALGLAAKRMGLLVDRSEVKVESGEPALTDEEWAALAELRHRVRPSRAPARGGDDGQPA